jgi:hypothetical protein
MIQRYTRTHITQMLRPKTSSIAPPIKTPTVIAPPIRDLLFNKIPGFAWRGEAAPSETWDFIGSLFYSKPLKPTHKTNGDRPTNGGRLGGKSICVKWVGQHWMFFAQMLCPYDLDGWTEPIPPGRFMLLFS